MLYIPEINYQNNFDLVYEALRQFIDLINHHLDTIQDAEKYYTDQIRDLSLAWQKRAEYLDTVYSIPDVLQSA